MDLKSGCGCKICKAGLGDITNDLIVNGDSPKSVIDFLQSKGVKVSMALLKKHLAAFELSIPDKNNDSVIVCEPVTVDLNKIDFTEYEFDDSNPESIISYLQKINLKIYLNQSKITLKAQQDVLTGTAPDMPREVIQNLAIAYQILEKSAGLSMRINQNEALKVVQDMGFTVQAPNVLPASSEVIDNG
jgi:hypothetical protein